MNKHIFPLQHYKHCSFCFFENNISFIQIFTRLILENQFPFKCNILKHNLGRVKESPTKTWSTWPLATWWLLPSSSCLQTKGRDWLTGPQVVCQRGAAKWSDTKTTHEAIPKIPVIKRPTHTTPTESISRVKNTSYHIESINPEVTASDFSTSQQEMSEFTQWLGRPYQCFCRQWINILH